jgi:hypothetical protein
MTLSNAERQRRFRTRRLGLGGKYERLNCMVLISTKRSVERLAFRFDCSITEMIERLINDKMTEVLGMLDDDEQIRFLAQETIIEDVQA